MRYIDHTGYKALERGKSINIETLGALTRKAMRIAEENRLGVLKTRQGAYRIIRESGLGAYSDILENLAEVDRFFKTLDEHADTRY